MAVNFERTCIRFLLIPVDFITFCWYVISIYWFWWMQRFSAPFSCSLLRSVGMRFQVLQKRDEDRPNALGKIRVKYETHKPVVGVTDPDLIKEMLVPRFSVFSDAKIQKRNQITGHCAVGNIALNFTQGHWETVRRSIALAFTPGKFRRSEHIMEYCCQELCETLASEAQRTELIDMKKIFDDFCMNMTFCLMFGINKRASEDHGKMLIVQTIELLRINLRRKKSFVREDTGRNLESFLGTAFMSDKDLLKFEEGVGQIIKQRVENDQIKTDFLQLLMESFLPEKDVNQFHQNEGSHNVFSPPKAMSSGNLIAHCLLFFAEGYRVTSSALSLVVYNLALNPSHQERLRKEVRNVLIFEKRIDFNSVGKMSFLDQVICETLRLHPPVSRLQRLAAEDCALGEAKLNIPKGFEIHIPLHALHRSSRHYPNPEEFDPRRFAPMQWSKRHPFSFIPFGVGERNCIGMKLALMEIKLCLVHLIKRFRFAQTTKTKIPLEFHKHEILTEPKEVHLHAEEITH